MGMAATPAFKVYVRGEYIASCKHAEDAAVVLAANGDPGGMIRYAHGLVLWREGRDGSAADSYDDVARLVHRRIDAMRRVLVDEIRRPKQADVDAVRREEPPPCT